MNSGQSRQTQGQPGAGRHILFYSNYCQYCKELVSLIVKKNVKHMFLLVSVDDTSRRYTLPPVVDRVPMIITADKQVISDDGLAPFVNALGARQDEVAPFAIQSGGLSAYSDSFSFLEGAECTSDFCRGFKLLSEEQSSASVMMQSQDVYESRSKSEVASAQNNAAYERLLSERDKDMQTLYATQQRQI